MADVTAPSGWYPDLHVPSMLRWWDGQTWTGDMASVEASAGSAATSTQTASGVRPAPARVPELVPLSAPEPRRQSGATRIQQDLDTEAAAMFRAMAEPGVKDRGELRTELRDLSRQIRTLRQEREVLQADLRDLGRQIPTLRQEREVLQADLRDLGRQIPTLRQERDDLLTAAVPLSAEVSDLRGKQDELIALRSEIQSLRQRKSSLDKSLAALQKRTEKLRFGRANSQRFHDS